jgi:FkbM family methyltransferase
LKKGFRVVAIEANPIFADLLRARFADAIQQARLNVINVAIGDRDCVAKFYLNVNDKISTVVEPVDRGQQWSEIEVKMTKLTTIIRQNGPPLFLKLDIEGAEIMALKDLFSAGCFPEYISAEAHSAEVLCLLIAAGYNQFKVVEGKFIKSRTHKIQTIDGSYVMHTFPEHSSGRFGEDLPGSWINVKDVFRYFCEYGVGWKNTHASQLMRTASAAAL